MKISDNLRIIEKEGLFYVEQKVRKCIFFYKWIPFITWSGLNKIYGFHSFDSALDGALLKIKYELISKNNK